MTEQEEKIARMYLLPRRPFLYGMARAFDVCRILDRGKQDLMLDGFKLELRQPPEKPFVAACQLLGDTLIRSMKDYQQELEASQRP